MLQALELHGFKSFADKTRFDFPRGITVVVGPNGSGKSNVVDAIKWVLGEQSVKSLRGKEMVDVIFNGSATRRPLNAAEVTLTFDNAGRQLAIDTPEVHITRRVYRGGEGEYLINRQACRLRDIRDLFAGTGMATEAYSVIEQGKVDVLLQSSARERRVIFEEAAGISRFKAKKVEALRRLERVEQNLLRLSDIVDEVEGRLRTVRLQAEKARRYREYSDRLQTLRTQVGSADYRALTARLETHTGETETLRQEVARWRADAERREADLQQLDQHLHGVEESIRTSEGRLAQQRERIVSLESLDDFERRRQTDLEEQTIRLRRQIAALGARAGDLTDNLQTTQADLQTASRRQKELSDRLSEEERALTALAAQSDQIRAENEQRRTSQLELMRAAVNLTNEIKSLDAERLRAEDQHHACRGRLAQLDAERVAAGAEIQELLAERERLLERLELRKSNLGVGRRQYDENRRDLSQRQRELGHWKEKLSGASERASVLEELERKLEGVSAGAKEFLRVSREPAESPCGPVRGLLADLLQADVDSAALIDLALGDYTQHLVAADAERLREYLLGDPAVRQGRVGFLSLESSSVATPEAPHPLAVDLSTRPGVLGRADRFVTASAELAPLLSRLLGNTWIVDRLETAFELRQIAGSNSKFVTFAGEVIDGNGAIVVGAKQSATGLLARRSELRAVRLQIAEWERKVNEASQVVAALEQRWTELDRKQMELAAAHQQAVSDLSEHRGRLAAAEGRRDNLDARHAAAENEAAAISDQLEGSTQARDGIRLRLEETQASLTQTEARLSENSRRIDQLDAARQTRSKEALAAKLEMARCEQQLEFLRGELRRFEQDRLERKRTLLEAREELERAQSRQAEADERILSATSELAELYLRKESFGGEAAELTARREQLRTDRAAAQADIQRHHNRARKLEDKLHQQELAAGALAHERSALADRLREDYGIELSALTGDLSESASAERAEIDQEIADLRRKLASIGGVNLDALKEADELEVRYQGLASQFQDLSQAKRALVTIVEKINADSRRLFADTLETVRQHFQALFRKLFGGGQADILLEENVDILESGIEIIARPPGKEPRNISLLSGGEKTLTCVALLLSIFRSRPSPFCVLDEVDAALDEANIERFVGVLNEFLVGTQFVVVTHSKKTMACANTLYGVTMQESGISKRVSVRFEDVSEDGRIDPSAVERDAAGAEIGPPAASAPRIDEEAA